MFYAAADVEAKSSEFAEVAELTVVAVVAGLLRRLAEDSVFKLLEYGRFFFCRRLAVVIAVPVFAGFVPNN